MTTEIFVQEVKRLDRSLSEPSCLFVDNASCHIAAGDLNLEHLKVIFLPANTTSKVQPMDSGIIQTVKLRYKSSILEMKIASLEAGADLKVDLLQAIYVLSDAWD